jgi:hypothetical protein
LTASFLSFAAYIDGSPPSFIGTDGIDTPTSRGSLAGIAASYHWFGGVTLSSVFVSLLLSARPRLALALALTIAPLPLLLVSQAVLAQSATSSSCQFLSSPGSKPAFCENLSGGAQPGGRAGDLDDSKWSIGRFVQGGISATNLIAFPRTPVGPCKSGVTSVLPDNDVMVCDSSSGHLGQFQTALIAQNYGMLALRPRQAFDFAGRKGAIAFNVDAITQGEGSWWPAVYVTDEPTSGAINSSSFPRMGLA